MNLVAYSNETKGLRDFPRLLWTVFTRFGFSETRIRRALYELIATLRVFNTTPTFFISANILRRHVKLVLEVSHCGVEIGIHGYNHDDYRSLKEEALRVSNTPGSSYKSNKAIFHEVVDLKLLSPRQRNRYEKSLVLFQAISPCAYTLRPHFEGTHLRIPMSIPDDEMLFDRLHITDPAKVGHIWCTVMKEVYNYGGIYTLNLHPERGILCKQALADLLNYARSRPRPVWLARLSDIAQWWKERSQYRLNISPLTAGHWLVEADCTHRATLLTRHLIVDYQFPQASSEAEDFICSYRCIVQATKCPCIALSPQTPLQVMDFLHEQGYPVVRSFQEDAYGYSLYLDMPEGLGITQGEQLQRCIALVTQIEQLDAPLLQFGYWPDNCHAALAIIGDIEYVTVQDFFLRIVEIYQSSSSQRGKRSKVYA